MTCGRLEVVSVDELASTTCHHTMAKARNGQIQRSQEGQCGRANLQSLAGCQGQNLSTQTQTCKHHIIIIITSKSHHIHHPSSNCITSTSKQKHITKHTHTHNFWLMSWSAAKLTQLWEYPESIDSSSVLLGGKKLKCN